jgi:predicted alpha/beta superfamily hydrolase
MKAQCEVLPRAVALLIAAGAAASGLAQATKPAARHATSEPAIVQVQFVVATPLGTAPPGDEIYLSTSLDGWPEEGRPLKSVAPGLYAATLPFAGGAQFDYKFTREKSWSTVEKDAAGRELSNRRIRVEPAPARQVALHHVARWADRDDVLTGACSPLPGPAGAGGARGSAAPTHTGTVQVLNGFESPQVGNSRSIYVYLPPGYNDDPKRRYPVLYVHDGQNLFDAGSAFAGVEWGLDESAEKLMSTGAVRPAIIVGIGNTPARHREYSPYDDARLGRGAGDRYLQFVVDTLKPYIDKNYRTLPEREHTFIGGSSLGGLISLHALLKYPNVFGGAAVISPALQVGRRQMLKDAANFEFVRPLRVWLDIGSREGELSESGDATTAVADARELAKLLEQGGLTTGAELHFEEIAGGEHNEAAWAARADRILQYLLSPSNAP